VIRRARARCACTKDPGNKRKRPGVTLVSVAETIPAMLSMLDSGISVGDGEGKRPCVTVTVTPVSGHCRLWRACGKTRHALSSCGEHVRTRTVGERDLRLRDLAAGPRRDTGHFPDRGEHAGPGPGDRCGDGEVEQLELEPAKQWHKYWQ
jgi:hypothetical protein